jgi:uracil-DNA glycosylase
MYNITQLIESLETDWKNDSNFMKIINKYSDEIQESLIKESTKYTIYPPNNLIFNAFNQFNSDDLRVIIIGQDPYINENEAMGLSFSIPNGTKIPPSLKNILKEIELEYGKSCDTDLTKWAKQGVLLLNKSLTVRQGSSNSHKMIWYTFTDDLIQYFANYYENIVYILWGNDAQSIEKYIDINNNFVLKAVHPSPLAQTGNKKFIGCNHFKQCNEYLIKNSYNAIKWV